MKKLLLSVAAVIAGAFVLQAADKDIPAYQDKSLPAEARARDLASRLTLDEKVSLLIFDSPAIDRLGIPSHNWWNETLHGVGRNGDATMYPMPIGMAASFDEKLLLKVFGQVSDEIRIKNRMARAGGKGAGWYEGLSFWTPNINIFRDPRWGRGMETYLPAFKYLVTEKNVKQVISHTTVSAAFPAGPTRSFSSISCVVNGVIRHW